MRDVQLLKKQGLFDYLQNSVCCLILEPESSLVIHRGRPLNSKVNFTCLASNAFPEPKLFLYYGETEDYHRRYPQHLLKFYSFLTFPISLIN